MLRISGAQVAHAAAFEPETRAGTLSG